MNEFDPARLLDQATPIQIAAFWFACAVVSAIIAQQKGEGLMALIVGCALGPLGILIALASSGNRIKCPNCLELMHRKARVCPHCRRDTKPRRQFPG